MFAKKGHYNLKAPNTEGGGPQILHLFPASTWIRKQQAARTNKKPHLHKYTCLENNQSRAFCNTIVIERQFSGANAPLENNTRIPHIIL